MGQNMWGYRCALVTIASLALATPLRAEDEASNESSASAIASKSHTPSDSERRIEAALDMPLRAPLQFIQTPLNQITEVIAEDYDIPIQFDTASLDAVASSPEVEVTIDIGNVSLRSALDLMLLNAGAEDLTYIINNEVLLITTQEEAEKRLEIRVYCVDDLLPSEFQISSADRADFDSLIDVITSTVEVDSWMDNGTGEGAIEALPPGMLVVGQTRRVHAQLEEVLQKLRAAKQAIDSDSAEKLAATAGQPVTRSIDLDDKVLADCQKARDTVRDALRKSVDWTDEVEGVGGRDVFLYVLPNRVLVRHVPEVVRQVEGVVREIVPAAPVAPKDNSATTSRGASGCSGGAQSAGDSSREASSSSPVSTTDSNRAPDLADASVDSEDGNQRQQRGGGGGFF